MVVEAPVGADFWGVLGERGAQAAGALDGVRDAVAETEKEQRLG
jgi:hypothetical protein